MKLTESEREHVLALDKFFCGPFSTPQTQANAIRHAEGVKELVTYKGEPDPAFRLYDWQSSPWD